MNGPIGILALARVITSKFSFPFLSLDSRDLLSVHTFVNS